MPSPQGHFPLAVRVARTFAAPRETVFKAWIDPEAIKVWFIQPTEGEWTAEPEIEARPGGRYRLTGTSSGKPWSIHGTYREVTPPERLVFTWEWDDYPNPGDSGDTVVVVEFFERGGETEIVLTHERFSNEAARDDHAKGWEECFDAIQRLLS